MFADRFTRREFLTHSLLAAATLSACSAEGRSARTHTPQRIIVIGAGLAGLSAAYELTQAGHDVRVLEAQARVGGRVLTLREPFADNLYAEAGAARIHTEQTQVLKYVQLFKLTLAPFYPNDEHFVRLRRGQRELIKWKKLAGDVEKFAIRLGKPQQWLRIAGGNDQLPQAFARALADKINYEAPVTGIEQDATGVRVRFTHKGVNETLSADRVLCAVPAALLHEISVTPPFSAGKQQVLAQLPYVSASRVFLQCRTRFWEQQQLNGYAVTEQPAEVWPASFGQAGVRGILQGYLRAEASLQLTELEERERCQVMLEEMERVFPGARTQFEHGVAKCWSEDEWARGAWAYPDERQLKQLAQPEGRIHFAGEHISSQPSWMQGALESAARAVREINQTAR